MKTIIKIQQKNAIYLFYILQSVCEISERPEINKLGFHGNEYPLHNKAYAVFQNLKKFRSANNEGISLEFLQHVTTH